MPEPPFRVELTTKSMWHIKMASMAVAEPKPFLYTFGLAGQLSRVPVREWR